MPAEQGRGWLPAARCSTYVERDALLAGRQPWHVAEAKQRSVLDHSLGGAGSSVLSPGQGSTASATASNHTRYVKYPGRSGVFSGTHKVPGVYDP
jgi:hypothetical protein